MNIRSGLKALAVALPMAVTPMKSTAQNVAKDVSKKAQTEVSAKLGLGYGRTAFFGRMNYEPKLVGSISARGRDAVAGFDATVGKATQEYKAYLGIPGKEYKAGHTDVGMVARYKHHSPSYFDGVALDCEVNSAKPEFAESVSLHRSTGFLGGYVSHTFPVGEVNITPHAEYGLGFLADFGSSENVLRKDLENVIRDERVVNRSNAKGSANLGLDIDANLDSGIRAGLGINHSTFDNSTSIIARMTYNIDRLFSRKK